MKQNNNLLKVEGSKKKKKKVVAGFIIALALSLGISGVVHHSQNHPYNEGIESESGIDIDEESDYEIEEEHDHENDGDFNVELDKDKTIENKFEEDSNKEDIIEENKNSTAIINKEDNINVDESNIFVLPDIGYYNGNSIVEALYYSGYDYSMSYRTKLAEYFNIENYRGTAEQNIKLLNLLKKYALDLRTQKNTNSNNSINNTNDSTDEYANNHNNINENRHNHTYILSSVSYDYKENDTHKKTSNYICKEDGSKKKNTIVESCSYENWISISDTEEQSECSKCHHQKTRIKENHPNHSWSEWNSKNDELEERTCSVGGETQTRSHNYGIPSITYKYDTEGKHIKTTTETCSECNHEKKTTLTLDCDNTYTYKNENYDTKTCNDCGHTEDLEHALGTITYEENQTDGIHNVKQTCSNCNHEFTNTENCSYGEWLSLDDTYEYQECSKCGDTKTRLHNYNAGITKYTYAENDKHTKQVEQTCTECNHKKTTSETLDCNNTYTYINDNYERKECSVCLHSSNIEHTLGELKKEEIENELNHYEVRTCETCEHDFKTKKECNFTGEWTVLPEDDKKEYRVCQDCGGKQVRLIHVHQWTNWRKKDDNLEVRICSFGEQETREHTFAPEETKYEILEDGTHRKTVTQKCQTCNHTKQISNTIEQHSPSSNKRYSEDKTIEYADCVCGHTIEATHSHNYEVTSTTDDLETKTCECGKVITEPHVYGTPVANGTKLTYTCPNCNHVKTIDVTHTHTLEEDGIEWVKSDKVCYKIKKVCKEDSYSETEDKAHTFSYSKEQPTSINDDVCYYSVATCSECQKVVKTPVGHDTYTIGNTEYCIDCDYSKDTRLRSFSLKSDSIQPLSITEEELDEIINQVIEEYVEENNGLTEEKYNPEIKEEEIITEEIVKEEQTTTEYNNEEVLSHSL